jgi:hypothetical protein
MLQREGKRGSGATAVTNSIMKTLMNSPSSPRRRKMPRLFSKIPASYNSSYFKFLRLALVGCLAWFISDLAKPIVNISPFVLCCFLAWSLPP